ncbi:hypothetical protein MANES_18G107600v8 [Manihot esculenta]|uniref:Uncharacterized protein n=1 Tax=Manihot esculenta TaxID=3983 RepID=A0A2C9U2G2_MANES|nr:hypothetical protein MANES_18G107600v8 [Manihot esculenta]
MVKLAEKERDSLEDVKNEAEAYMLKELSLLKWAKIQENHKTLKEIEVVHKKYIKRQEELGNDLLNCKEEFKEFERQDVKYGEDLKHKKQKIKKLEDKLNKDSSKIEHLTKEWEESTNMIPKLEDDIPKLQKLLLDEERVLEDIVLSEFKIFLKKLKNYLL